MSVNVRVTIDRAAAILAGSGIFGHQIFPIDPADLSESQRKALVECPWTDNAYSLVNYKSTVAVVKPDTALETIRTLLDEIAAHQRKVEEKNAKEARASFDRAMDTILKWLATPDDDLMKIAYIHGQNKYVVREPSPYDLEPIRRHGKAFQPEESPELLKQVTAKVERLKAAALKTNSDMESREAERRRIRLMEMEQQAREEEAAEQRRLVQMADWIDVHGTENQKKRFKANLLPKDEVLTAMRNYAFSSLDPFARFKRLTKAELLRDLTPEDEYGYSGDDKDVDFETEPASEADAAEFDALEAIEKTIRKTYPDAKAELIVHIGTWERSKERLERKSVRVTVPFGDFTFTREYAAPLESAAAAG